jgi:hypothetical protein
MFRVYDIGYQDIGARGRCGAVVQNSDMEGEIWGITYYIFRKPPIA